jgi:hypothetical protein
MGGAFGAALAVGLAVLLRLGSSVDAVAVATQAVARVAFVFFWPAYAGGALAALFGPAFAGLARHRRAFGLAFAAALLVHLAFVAWLFRISSPQPISDTVALYFGVGALWAYGLTLGSWKPLRDVFGARLWRIFSTAGLEYIAFLFFRDFVLLPLQYDVRHPLTYYGPFAILIIVAALLRWTAALRGLHLQVYAQRRSPP